MQIVIDVPEGKYKTIMSYPKEWDEWALNAIKNGIPIPKGRWIEENINEWSRKIFCSECGCPPPFEHVSNGDVYSASGYGVSNKTRFCPNCGAKMVEPAESEIGK